LPAFPSLQEELKVDVAIIGAGFTGLSAAHELALAGADVAVLESETVGWGASGRNGGFCCLGGAKISDARLDQRFGKEARLDYRRAERLAVEQVAAFLARYSIDADVHSEGETELAHRSKDFFALERDMAAIEENYGVEPLLLSREALAARGITGPFHGGLEIPIGFGLNPRKYLRGLQREAIRSGARIFEATRVDAVTAERVGYRLVTGSGSVRTHRVVIATNGYSSDNLLDSLRNRFMPAQSTVLVTHPLPDVAGSTPAWSSEQMCYDSRALLHYFRKLPDGRFLFGMRGGLMGGAQAEARARARLLAHFHKMFPLWREVEVSNIWSGLVALARKRLPFAGACEGAPGIYAALCYHGNGVAMGSFCGRLVAQTILGREPEFYPRVLRTPMAPFPLGRFRRLLMPPLYAGFLLADL
jgi:glycine/D-amino acid oxidase-like deaminating enzyme